MDELELLKKDWQKNNNTFEKKSSSDLYAMLHKKSSNIVKTLFYISIAELLFWICINTIPMFTSDGYKQKLDAMYSDAAFIGITIFTYAIILLFVFLLYKSYKNISVTDSARKLMKNILKTRKVIRYYVIYNLAMVFVSMVFGFIYSSGHDPELAAQIEHFNTQQYIVMIAMFVIATLIFGIVIWLFYKLLYGILLKRLNKNYNELKKMEV
ncbi:TRAP-type uncharacterized transport system fused permease subunit [Mesoflavibacter sabulilitoris]|uniref:Beta-carotene 15,15'-monooxygenase n=1 Tax=Mesoflavibacter zeaxanthinifaciens subsp. sabulilitoris TaxID=1520893 RepID=A0A2T1NKW1_9FLAO|nr:hypothetical protein [Mesoflavibacter zeaxanthinifaciens]MBB3122541.1 TRAP-type uncharacterized transport system fused permease subunit [Mesoflavibacter zeaxanthinifaciens subsp. sabulilitoris]PSG93500.1 hypothetical protein C7H61_03020 [Mesoflavibacter zeaxanthinifaciens subsp. sabulilitoris]